MNKMQRPEQEITRYGAEDVIATSGGGIITDSTDLIWLDKNSVINFNDLYDNDLNLSVYDGYASNYYAFNGDLLEFEYISVPKFDVKSYNRSTTSPPNAAPTVYTTMAKGDKNRYKEIFDWLNRNR